MELNKQIEALARMEGYKNLSFQPESRLWNYPNGGYCANIPTYDTHDDIQRLIDGFKGDENLLHTYDDELLKITGWMGMSNGLATYLATVDQKIEALLKAKGMWTDDEC
jgi:hypothetical protein